MADLEEKDLKPIRHEVTEHFELKNFRERVLRLEAENKELRMGNKILQNQYTSQVETQSDILRSLHSSLEEKEDKVEEQERRLEDLEEQLRKQAQAHKDELAMKEVQWKSEERKYLDKIKALEDQLDKERDFKRPEMEAALDDRDKQIEALRQEHASDISALERRKAIEFDGLRQDMVRKVENTREFLKGRTRDQLKGVTRRTIMENQQKAAELNYQNRETEKIIAENKALRYETAELKRKIAIHKDLETELARRTHIYQKLIKKMDEKTKVDVNSGSEESDGTPHRKLTLKDEKESMDIEETQARVELAQLEEARVQAQEATEESDRLQRQVDSIQSNLQTVRNEYAQYRRDHATLTQLQDQSTRLVISALYELKNQRECDPFPPLSYDEHADWQFVHMNPRQKEYFFRMLLERLNSSMCMNCFPTGAQLPQQLSKASSLPSIQHSHDRHGQAGPRAHDYPLPAQGSQFLWSVASGSPEVSVISGREVVQKAVQTESSTSTTDAPWSIQSKGRLSESSSATLGAAGLRGTWGPRALSQTSLKLKSSTLGVSGPVPRTVAPGFGFGVR